MIYFAFAVFGLSLILWGLFGWYLYYEERRRDQLTLEEIATIRDSLIKTTSNLNKSLDNINTTLILSRLAEDNGPIDLSELDEKAITILKEAMDR